MAIKKRLSMIGNSLGLIFDKPILELLSIEPQTELNITTDGRRLILEPVKEDHKKRVARSINKIMKKHDATFRKLAK